MCWHKWTKWEQYIFNGEIQANCVSTIMLPVTERRQRRRCVKCGKEQDAMV